MRKSILLAMAALVATPSPLASKSPTAGTGSPSFQAPFRGDWYSEARPCNPDNLALEVGATSLNYFDEFAGRLTHIIRQTDRTVHYTAEYSAEGHVWTATETLRLSPNGNEMTLEPERTSARYFRCKKVNGTAK
jgi:hypothetical protein